LVLFIACETLFPTIALLPVSSQTLDIIFSFYTLIQKSGCKDNKTFLSDKLFSTSFFKKKF
jgi:hypothetical protein